MSGIGIGIGNFVMAFWTQTIGCTRLSVSNLKSSASTLVCASMSTLSAGCGVPTRISGPQYATLVAGFGPGSR